VAILTSPFRLERDMLQVARSVVPEHFRFVERTGAVLCEPMIGSVIPDLLLGFWTLDASGPKKNLTGIETSVLAVIERERRITEKRLFSEIFLPKATAEKVLAVLEKAGSITRPFGEIAIARQSVTKSYEVIAIELKLQRWREAISQAVEYKRFANRSFILVDALRHRDIAKLKQECKANGVGLMLQSGEILSTVYRPKSQVVISAERHIAIQKLRRMSEFTNSSISSTSDTPTATLPDASYQYA
jgi:hypothetical protein